MDEGVDKAQPSAGAPREAPLPPPRRSGRIRLSAAPLVPTEIESLVLDNRFGAVLTFSGRVRSENEGAQVISLEYEAYGEMVLSELERIFDEAEERFPLHRAAVAHRVGHLALGDIAVVLSVATPHRREGFELCAWLIDTLKARAPIFKKEARAGGEVWIGLGP